MRSMLHPMTRKPGPRRALSCVQRSTRAMTRTLPVEQPSNSVIGGRSGVRAVETEVTDGFNLVVTARVLNRFIRGDAHHGIDVHVRFSVRTIGASPAARASRFVGRILTRKDRCADTARPLFENGNTLHRSSFRKSPVQAGLFFLIC